MNKNSFKLCVITIPLPEIKGIHVLVENFLQLLEALTENIYLITGNYPQSAVFSSKIHLKNVKYDSKKQSMLIKVPKYVIMQLTLSSNLVKIAKYVDMVIFYVGGTPLLLPMLAAKLSRKKVIIIAAGSSKEVGKHHYKQSLLGVGGIIFPRIIGLLETANYALSDKIILYSPNLTKEWNLEKYKNKICIAHEHFIDFDKFKIKRRFDERENLVGYIGRLREEKGTLNFVKAIPDVLEERNDIKFLIGGDGQLRDKIERYLEEENLNDKVKLTGWIPHDELPGYMNELKLVILPSYTEGLPNVMLEAMACGTPVLATSVGGVPDVIKDGETGFILEDNSPKCITENVLRVLNYPNLDEIVKNARGLVEKEFTYEAAVEKYRKILKSI